MSELLSRITDIKALSLGLIDLDRGESRRIDEPSLRSSLKARVRGQDHVIDDLVRLVRVQWAKQRRDKPVANLLFLGPTGTGKTELAKGLAEALFGDESSMLRIDCAELAGPEAKNHLLGNPLGFVGATSGGKLTRPMLNNPRRLVLFDEVEKAWRDVADLFLGLMGEGRLTEPGSGKTADFSQALVVLTTNAEHEAIRRIHAEVTDEHERNDAVKKHLCDCQVFRPEVLGRIDRIYVFQPLDAMTTAEVVAIKMVKLAREYGIELCYVNPALILEAMQRGRKLKDFGVRELDRIIGDLMGEALLTARENGQSQVELILDDDARLGVRPVSPRNEEAQ
jgi:ATP-dependent Clp protease ATP-binding subunit ClpA